MEEIMRQAINQAAEQLIEELGRRSLIPPLTTIPGGVIPWGGGLYKVIASFGNDRPHVAIWGGDLLIDRQPALWVGFGANDDPTLQKLLKDCRSEFPDTHQPIRSDAQWRDWEQRIRNAPDLGQPTVVDYPPYRGFGVYRRWGDAGVQAASKFIEQVLRSLPEFPAMEMLCDVKAIENSSLEETEKEVHRKARVGQGEFRERLEVKWENKCAVLRYATPELLRASHIKPWRICENKDERLGPDNGLLLAAHLDALFDRGLISFKDDGSMMISAKIKDDPKQLNLGEKLWQSPSDAMKIYLKYHREEIFKSPEA